MFYIPCIVKPTDHPFNGITYDADIDRPGTFLGGKVYKSNMTEVNSDIIDFLVEASDKIFLIQTSQRWIDNGLGINVNMVGQYGAE